MLAPPTPNRWLTPDLTNSATRKSTRRSFVVMTLLAGGFGLDNETGRRNHLEAVAVLIRGELEGPAERAEEGCGRGEATPAGYLLEGKIRRLQQVASATEAHPLD